MPFPLASTNASGPSQTPFPLASINSSVGSHVPFPLVSVNCSCSTGVILLFVSTAPVRVFTVPAFASTKEPVILFTASPLPSTFISVNEIDEFACSTLNSGPVKLFALFITF